MRASLFVAGAVGFSLAACASHPDKIEAAYVSPLKYQSYNCEQLTLEIDHVSERTSKLYHKLKKIRSTDNAQMTLGLLILWPMLFFVEGGDGPEAAEYAQLKGEYDALWQNTVEKECQATANSPEQIMNDLARSEDAADASLEEEDFGN